MTLCGGKDFGQMFADKIGGKTWPCGEETRGDGGVLGRHDGAESDRWRYWTMSDLVESVWTLFENGECGGMGVTGDCSTLWRSM